MSIAQGINKVLVFFKQTGLGVPGTVGAHTGSQAMRRETGIGKLTMASFANTELTTFQQSTGKQHGLRSATYALSGLLSPNTYSTLFSSLLRKLFTATTALTGLGLTIAGTAGAWTATGTGFLTGGLKIGDIFRITTATGLNADNLNKNFLISNLTATVITFTVVNGTTITTGTGTACTITIPGKKCLAPLTGQTQEYWTIEEWQTDIAQSELFTDMVMGSADISLPSSGNTTCAFNLAGLNRTTGATQVLTSPAAVTTTPILTAVQGDIIVNGVAVANITGATIKIDCAAANMGGVIGTNFAPDVQRQVISVSGQLTAFYQDGVMPGYFDASTPINVVIVVATDGTAASDFVSFSMSSVILDGDDKDDGQKGIVRTYPFTARMNPNGGTALANDQTIISIQDSQAA
ncbi:hypothetical protein UFOVP1516_78 [uncultured Caudovirales phage]|uniref:Uncharacterized protein n=1 Tax=uncultured Caudovirales phage TaxID=2100421 RepID=A0A6J5PBF0_9CAUD|nr:hypothetical protein UFOVP887_57 [uncultured Caudovirales phage]CAB5226956.1 hypothetical protein UFOVP1516_78 [uncultured Caudovirales phage]